MAVYRVLSPVQWDGMNYAPGATVNMPPETAAQALDLGVLAEEPAAAAAAAAAAAEAVEPQTAPRGKKG